MSERKNIRESIELLEERCTAIEMNLDSDVRIAIQRILQVERLELEKYQPQNMGEKIVESVRQALIPRGGGR